MTRNALTWTWRLATALLLVSVLLLRNVGAQDPLPGDLVGDRLVRLHLPFVEVEATDEERAAWQASPEWRGVVTTGLGPATVTVNTEEIEGDGVNSELRLVLGIERDGRTTYWEPGQDAPIPDGSWRERERYWRLFGLQSRVQIAPASGVEGVLVAKYAAEFRYNSGYRDVFHRVAIDLRPRVPMVVADVLEDVGEGRCYVTTTASTATCTWDAARQDFRCAEIFADTQRETWLVGRAPVERPRSPGAPRDIGDFVDRLPRPAPAGRWAELPDVGSVRVLAEVPTRTRGRRIVLFATSSATASPLFVVVRDAAGTRISQAREFPAAEPGRDIWREPLPAEDFRPTGEPPSVTARPFGDQRDGGARLYAVVTATEGELRLTHLGVEEYRDVVYVDAVTVARSGTEIYSPLETDVSVCESEYTTLAQAVSAVARSSPTRIEYVIEPTFENTPGGPRRPDAPCTVSSTATWRQGFGFDVRVEEGACAATRFTAVLVTPDGRLVPRRYDVPQR